MEWTISSPGAPRPGCSKGKRAARQVSWLPGHHLASAFPGCIQCRTQWHEETTDSPVTVAGAAPVLNRIPFSCPVVKPGNREADLKYGGWKRKGQASTDYME